jgi:rootletin
MTTPTASQLIEENRYLNDELNRVETILNSTRAEKDELSIRYNAISDRVSFSMIMLCLFLFCIEDLVRKI